MRIGFATRWIPAQMRQRQPDAVSQGLVEKETVGFAGFDLFICIILQPATRWHLLLK